MVNDQPDFFISYTSVDEHWATWIAWVLEEAKYKTVLQAWDFAPGSNFIVGMQEAAQQAKKTIAVFTPAYLGASYTVPEWAAAIAEDPKGWERKLVPIVAEPCDPEGLLSPLVHINLVGLDQATAKQRLLAGLAPGRSKPLLPPEFPGPASSATSAARASASQPRSQLRWEQLSSSPVVVWRTDAGNLNYPSSGAVLELHLVPTGAQRLEMRQLRGLTTELGAVGRARGLFSAVEGLNISSKESLVAVRNEPSRDSREKGLLVTRAGQRSVWFTLPSDNMGSVLDLHDVQPRLQALLELLLELPFELQDRYALALGVGPTTMLSVGDASVVGRRSSASMSFFGREDLRIAPEDAVATTGLTTHVEDVVEELLARLEATCSNSR